MTPLPSRLRFGPGEAERALAVACEAARRAGRLQVEHYERLERVEHKGARDVVTEVDRLCEGLILGEIRAAFPRDAILAEESGAHRGVAEAEAADRAPWLAEDSSGTETQDNRTAPADGGDPTGGARRAWIVDPLDGTINYANGIPVFCVCIGLAVAGEVVLGVVYDPMRDELFTATRGRGASLNGRPISPPDKELLSDYVVSLGMPARGNALRRRRVGRAIRAVRNLGSAGLSLTYVANGRFDAFIQVGGLSNWDIAGPGCIAREAGVVVTGVAGEPWFDLARATRTIGIVAAPARHHGTLLGFLR